MLSVSYIYFVTLEFIWELLMIIIGKGTPTNIVYGLQLYSTKPLVSFVSQWESQLCLSRSTCSLSSYHHPWLTIHIHINVHANQVQRVRNWHVHMLVQFTVYMSSLYTSALHKNFYIIDLKWKTKWNEKWVKWKTCHVEYMPHSCSSTLN